jgi:hypothetical protein
VKKFIVWDEQGVERRMFALVPRDAAVKVAKVTGTGKFRVLSPEDLHESEVVVTLTDLAK